MLDILPASSAFTYFQAELHWALWHEQTTDYPPPSLSTPSIYSLLLSGTLCLFGLFSALPLLSHIAHCKMMWITQLNQNDLIVLFDSLSDHRMIEACWCHSVCVALTGRFYWGVIKSGGSVVVMGVKSILQILLWPDTHTHTHKGQAFLMAVGRTLAPGTELLI